MIFYGSSLSTNFEVEEKVNIEINISERGLPGFEIYGLINKSIEESKKRIINSFENIGVVFPLKNVVVNLSPADISKEGTHFDLGIAATLMKYTSLLNYNEKSTIFLGELSLDGSIKGIKNILYLVLTARSLGFKEVYVPYGNLDELHCINDLKIIGLKSLVDLLKLDTQPELSSLDINKKFESLPLSFNKIYGNKNNKKILAYALSGNHHLLISGFPGSGKSLLSKSAVDLIPDLDSNSAFDVSKIYSYLGIKRSHEEFLRPPFRSPHNSSSYASIFGGVGKSIIPGEVCIANKGILFLDEFPEFNRLVIEGLRTPLEDKYITISRSKYKKILKTDFLLIATMNPCKCGYFNHHKIECKCSPVEVRRYKNKISGPILDRIDIQINFDGRIETEEVSVQEIYSYGEFKDLKEKIEVTKNLLNMDSNELSNKNISFSEINKFTQKNFTDKAVFTLNSLQEKYSVSNRRYFKILNLSKTISFFNRREKISEEDVLEALYLTGTK